MSACSSSPGRASLLAVTVPPEWSWAVAVRNTSVLNVHAPPPASALGGYVAVCAGAEHEPALSAWTATWCAVGAPPAAELPTCAVVAVGWLDAVSQHPDGPRESPWYVGPVGLWLADVVPLPEPVPTAPPEGVFWELPDDVLAQVRAAYSAVRQADAARWREYETRAQAALNTSPPPGLKARVLRLCTCRRAMTPCPACREWRCTNATCLTHACAPEARP